MNLQDITEEIQTLAVDTVGLIEHVNALATAGDNTAAVEDLCEAQSNLSCLCIAFGMLAQINGVERKPDEQTNP